jgi:hypothetical protein
MKSLLIAVLGALAGCATNAAVENDQSIAQFVADFSGKELRVRSPASSSDSLPGDSTLSGARDAEFGYAGLRDAYAPAQKTCVASAGTLRIASQRSFSKAGPNLPVRLRCIGQDKTVWELNVQYVEKHILDANARRIVSLVPQANLVVPTDSATQPAKREANLKTELRAKAKERTRAGAEYAEKILAEPVQKTSKSGVVANFRRNLKAGDRVQWTTSDMRGKTVGIVARVDGDLALVQFDNPSFTGQSLRYFKRSQLEPVDGNLPVRATQ